MPTFCGRVLTVRHHSEDFAIYELSVESSDPPSPDKTVWVSGHLNGLAQIKVGMPLGVQGRWIQHVKYGRQLTPVGWTPYAKTSADVARFLSMALPAFEDADFVSLLIQRFNDDVYHLLDHEPDEIRRLYGGDDPRRVMADRAISAWNQARSVSALSVFLQEYGLPPYVVKAIFAQFGELAIGIISQNPYRLVAVAGFTFARADNVALRTGIGLDDPRRVEGAVLWLLRQEALQGHLCVRRGDLPVLLSDMMEQDEVEPFPSMDVFAALMAAVDRLAQLKIVMVDPEAGVYLPEFWQYEREGAAKLAKFITPSKIEIDLVAFLAEYEKAHAIELSDTQREAVRLLLDNRVLVLTGLPGTGKSTLVRTFVRLFREANISVALMAPTGIAAKRLASVAVTDARTIHRTFRYTGGEWGFDNYSKFSIGAVIVDEMSMVDQELFYRILDALDPTTMLILVGDDAQLPSVGPGNVLRELMSCGAIPHVRLTQIFRQTATSEIVLASHQINRGEAINLDRRPPTSEFQFINIPDDHQVADLIVKMAEKLKAKDANFQVLSPKYDGVTGVTNLNTMLRERLNPDVGQKEFTAGKLHFRMGDRVMVVKNDYKLNVYNGDVGKIRDITKEEIVVQIHGGAEVQAAIPKSKIVDMLRLAYCITVHKSQGSEFDTIILPIVRGHGRMRQRNLFYTAVTRAKRKVWLLGDPQSVHTAIANDRVIQRNTAFGRAISEAVGVEVAHGRSEAPQQSAPVRSAVFLDGDEGPTDAGDARPAPEGSGQHQLRQADGELLDRGS